MNRILMLLCLSLCSLQTEAQESLSNLTPQSSSGTLQEFVISGKVNLPDDYTVGLCCSTDTCFSVEMGETVIRDGQFVLKGLIEHPLQGMLTTNNLALVEQNNWPMDSIHWTYNQVFVSAGQLAVVPSPLYQQPAKTDPYQMETSSYQLVGSQVQTDYNEWLAVNGEGAVSDEPDSKAWQFIDQHPHSVVSVWLANDLLKRGYNLTLEQVCHLEQTITSVPLDTMRMSEFTQRIAYAMNTTVGGQLVDLELLDTKGNTCHLVDVVPKGQYVLVDFWASWCGICLASMPEVAKLAEEYDSKFAVIAVSIDKKDDAWRKAMQTHPEPWPQYITTERGYHDLFEKYQVGNGVPYYIILTPDGRVLNSPSTPAAVREVLKKFN